MKNSIFVKASVAVVFLTQTAWGAGYERTIMWSGKQVGVAGAGAATVHGAEAIYFNPAGLSNTEKLEVSGNFSPTFVSSQGPVLPNTSVSSDTSFLPVFGLTAAYKLLDKLGVGAGVYVGGGSRAVFSGVDFSSVGFPTLKPAISSEVTMIEASLGVSYEVLPGFKLGAAWRVTQVSAHLDTASIIPGTTPVLAAITVDGLSHTAWNGFRLGAQYDGDNWGVGGVLRTSIGFTLSGTSSGNLQVANSSTTIPLTGGAATVSNTFPMQGVLGGYYDLMNKDLRLIGELSYTNYSVNQQLLLTGTMSAPGPIALDLSQTPVAEHWQDLYVIRIGGEYRGFTNNVLRAGYAYTSQVTPKAFARPTFSSPGPAHTIAIGGGHTYMNKTLDLDVALEYSFASGTVAASDIPAGGTTQPGNYSTSAYAAHLGATYRF